VAFDNDGVKLIHTYIQTLSLFKRLQELEKGHPNSLRAIENQVAPLLDHVCLSLLLCFVPLISSMQFKTSLFMFLRSRSDEIGLEDLTLMT
jgi:hypothetical protein